MCFAESQYVELKREFSEEIKKSVVAFANTNEGTIYIGVGDDGDICGVADADAVLCQVSNAVRDAVRPDVTMFVDYAVLEAEAKKIIRVSVQKGSSSPYYLASKGLRPEGVYVRQGLSSVPASETVILNMIRETDGEQYEEVRSLNQQLTFIEADAFFAERGVQFGENQKKTMGVIRHDGVYSNLGLLLSDQCPHTIKAAVFAGEDKTEFKDRTEIRGSLFKQMKDAVGFLERYNTTSAQITGIIRTDRTDYPPQALREALLNLIVHRDYTLSASAFLNLFSNRIEFLSAGGLVRGISLDEVKLGLSMSRNSDLANVFYRLGLIEAYGTGIPKIFASYGDAHLTPLIEATNNAFKITLYRQDERPKLRAGSPGTPSHFTSNERKVLAFLQTREVITRKEVESLLGISQSAAVNLLRSLREKGALRADDKGKNRKYLLI